MANQLSPGARFRKALKENQPLQIVGTINAYTAMMAEPTPPLACRTWA
jgi:methylisocitrate lyase